MGNMAGIYNSNPLPFTAILHKLFPIIETQHPITQYLLPPEPLHFEHKNSCIFQPQNPARSYKSTPPQNSRQITTRVVRDRHLC